MDGSSFSAPIITGIAGVLLSLFPNISIYSIKDCILKGATRIRGFPGKFPDISRKIQIKDKILIF